jgi:hypothetical protein
MPRKAGAAAGAAPADEASSASLPSSNSTSGPSVAVPTAKKVGAQFNVVETRELLRIVSIVKPIGGQGWSEVERQFNEKAAGGGPFKVRAANSLKSRFQRLAAIEKPTGEGEMPELIRFAKEINEEIHSMIDAGTLDENDDDADDLADAIEALHEGPEPGGADSSEPTEQQLQEALARESAGLTSPSPVSSSVSVNGGTAKKASRAPTQAAQQVRAWSASRNAKDALDNVSREVQGLTRTQDTPMQWEAMLPMMMMQQMQAQMARAAREEKMDRLMMMHAIERMGAGGSVQRTGAAAELATEHVASVLGLDDQPGAGTGNVDESEWREFKAWQAARKRARADDSQGQS